MKRTACMLCALLVGAGTVLAEGGKNQGETGNGDTSAGDQAQGQADQSRAGRDDRTSIFEIMNQGDK